MQDSIEIQPLSKKLNGTIRPPGSKSITNRALLIAAIAEGKSILDGVLESDDTRVMIDSLRRLGIAIEQIPSKQQILIQGCGGRIPIRTAHLNVENSGTSIRFLTAVLGVLGGEYLVDGVERMRARPIGPLIEALRMLGADVVAMSPLQCPPVRIHSSRLSGGHVKIRGNLSSQYLSGLLLAAPMATNGMIIELEGELVSKPYVSMTLQMMQTFGVECTVSPDLSRFEIFPGQTYVGRNYTVEPDASAASYFWAAAAICGGEATVKGLNENSLQGDVRFVRVLESMGCQLRFGNNEITVVGPACKGIDVDMGSISDMAQTLAAVACFVQGPTIIRNIAHNRIKETDRIHFLAVELRKLGVHVVEFPDGLKIDPQPIHGASIETYSDHRMAMSLALIGLRIPGLRIMDPTCVSKTYPNYFRDLKKFCKN